MGYFVSGWPKTYFLPPASAAALPQDDVADSIRAIAPDPLDRYVITVSSAGLYVWSARQHRVLVGRFFVSDAVLAEEGPFVECVWSPDGRATVAGMENGLVLMFSVRETSVPDGRTSVLDFRSSDLSAEGFAAAEPVLPVVMRRVGETRVSHTPGKLTAMCACSAGALIGTSTGGLTCVGWDGDVLWRTHVPELLRNNGAMAKMGIVDRGGVSSEPAVAAIQTADAEDDAGGVTAIAYDASLGFCGVVLGAGLALLLGLNNGGFTRPSAIDGRWLRSDNAVSIALEPRRMLATVGLADGDVEQYYVGVPAGDRCPIMRRLSLSSWYFEPTDVGGASVLRWTRDGTALVVGWEKRGLAVWSVSGCRLMWTLPQVGGTLPTTPGLRNKDTRTQSFVHPMEQGVMAAAWGPQGLFMWAAPRRTAESPRIVQESHFMEFTFFKSSVNGNSCQNDSARLAMYGSDRVLLLWHADIQAADNPQPHNSPSNDLFSWQHLPIPHDYLWKNWPPTRIAVNNTSSHVAVAGEYGVAICQVRAQRWRVFGDLEHDRRIRCCALAWVGKTIVIGNEIDSSKRRSGEPKTFELLFYPRDQLDSSALQAQRKLPSRPSLIDVRADGYLLVLCEDSVVYLFKMTEHYNGSRIDLRQMYRLLLPTREVRPMYQQDQVSRSQSLGGASTHSTALLPAAGGGISEARIFPPLGHARSGLSAREEVPVPTYIMLLRSTGSLILLDTQGMVSTPLLRYVERFWYTPATCTPFDVVSHRPIWWAYGDDGLHVCFQDGMRRALDDHGQFMGVDDGVEFRDTMNDPRPHSASRRSGVQVEQWFELDPEVYPLAVMSRFGMVLGATQGLMTHAVGSEGGAMPSHVIQVKRQPILHTLLRHLLMKPVSDDRIALQVALKCVSQPQFVDSLEWLLYEAVLEHDDDAAGAHRVDTNVNENGVGGNNITDGASQSRKRRAGGELFPRVIRLLRYFGEYEDIVVRCARKLDSKRWPLLFSLAGEPAALLEQCFVSGRLRTAACLLVILQEMWGGLGFLSSTPHSLRLVEAALRCGELGLAADLASFLTKADRAGMLNSSQLRTTEDVSWITDAVLLPRGAALDVFSSRGVGARGEASARIPAVDLAVLNHARLLLSKMELRNLAALAVRMDFPLAEWLKRELKGKNASRPFVRDFGSTILSLHRQFQYPEPDVLAVRRAMRIFNQRADLAREGSRDAAALALSPTNGLPMSTPRTFASKANVALAGSGADTVFGSQLPPPPSSYDSEHLMGMRAKARYLCRQELLYLLTVGRAVRAPDLILCCATLLMDISVLRMVLRAHDELFEPYTAALKEFNVSGYIHLADVLQEIAIPR